jgi:hypothetical protein
MQAEVSMAVAEVGMVVEAPDSFYPAKASLERVDN